MFLAYIKNHVSGRHILFFYFLCKVMAKKLFFGGLSFTTTEDTLQNLCSQYGTVVSVKIINDKMTGRSKGFGFVEMSTDEEALKVIEAFNGKEIDGRTVTVNEARPMEERPPRGNFQRKQYN